MPRIPEEYIQEVTRRNDIVDVVKSYVQLRHRGRTCTGLCPFHSEKTPSFVVYPENQSFYCFGCGVGGSVITFVEKIDNIGYVEAVKALASRAGMALPEEDDGEGRMRSRILSINKELARYFYQQLNAETDEARIAREYWRGKRGLSDATIRRFGLGYAPDNFHGIRDFLHDKGYTDEEMLAAGVIKRSEKGNLFNAFWHRVMVPIIDLRGSVIAFGGRVLDDSKPKYVNSPETLVYKKSHNLFALNVAKKSTSKRYILCEGYMDVISMHQAGIDTAVCACGTALTPEQVKLISEYADEVILSYDSDEAGQKATTRSLELFANSPVKVSVLNIPGAKDPDEFIKTYGRDRFEALLNGTANRVEFNLRKLRDKNDIGTDKGRLQYIKDAVELLAGPITETEREVYAGRLAEETGIAKSAILTQTRSAQKRVRGRAQNQRQKQLEQQTVAAQIKVPYSLGGEKALGVANAEQQLMAAMLKDPDVIAEVEKSIQPEDLLMPEMQEACRAVFTLHRDGVTPTLATLSQELEPPRVAQLAQILARNSGITLTPEDVRMFIYRIKKSLPKSSQADKMSGSELEKYFESLKSEKT